MFNKFKNKIVERSNKRILEYVLNTPDIWLEVLRVINNKYENKIFKDLIIKENHFNNLKLQGLTILGRVSIVGNTYVPEDHNPKSKKKRLALTSLFLLFNKSVFIPFFL